MCVFFVMIRRPPRSTLFPDTTRFRAAEQAREWLQAAIEQDTIYDAIAGAAGAIGGLLSLYRCRPSRRTLDVAIQCGDWLLDRKSTRLNSSHANISYAVFCLQKPPLLS